MSRTKPGWKSIHLDVPEAALGMLDELAAMLDIETRPAVVRFAIAYLAKEKGVRIPRMNVGQTEAEYFLRLLNSPSWNDKKT